MPPVTSLPALGARRLASVDAYRGLVMFLMLGEALRLGRTGDRATGLRQALRRVTWTSATFVVAFVLLLGILDRVWTEYSQPLSGKVATRRQDAPSSREMSATDLTIPLLSANVEPSG